MQAALLVLIPISLALAYYIDKTIILNKQIISLYGIINGLKVENNILENRLELLEEIIDVQEEEEL